MGPIREAFLTAASSAVALVGEAAVAAAWEKPSALAEFRVSGLAGHLARQVIQAPVVLATPVPDEPPRSLLEHFTGSSWTTGSIDDEVNVNVRRKGEREAAEGQAALVARAAAALEELRPALAAEPVDRVVRLPWAEWSLTLNDYLVTRLVEIAVHNDDLAVSVGLPTPPLPAEVLDPVLDVLTRLAVHRHGPVAVLRALSRAERAPATIAAI